MGLASQSGGCGLAGSVVLDSCGSGSETLPSQSQTQPTLQRPVHYCEATTRTWIDCRQCCRKRSPDAPGRQRCFDLCRSAYPPPPLQKSDWCTKSPDKIHGVDFASCCKTHDHCYYECRGRSACDGALCGCLTAACAAQSKSRWQLAKCLHAAATYCATVKLAGWKFYPCGKID